MRQFLTVAELRMKGARARINPPCTFLLILKLISKVVNLSPFKDHKGGCDVPGLLNEAEHPRRDVVE
jgi:hypothetical protein